MVIDEEAQNAFNLNSSDEAFDHKLLQMFRLFNKSLDASLFGKVNVEH